MFDVRCSRLARLRFSALLCALVLLLPAVVGADDETVRLDLQKAIARSLQWNRELRRAAKLLRRNELDIEGSLADFAVTTRPDATAGVSGDGDDWQYGLRSSKRFFLGTEVELAGRVNRSELSDQEFHRATLEVEIQQPIFRNFGSLIHGEALLRANNSYKEAQRLHERQKADQIVQVVTLYETIFRLERQIASDDGFHERMDKLYRLTKARERQGHTTRVDTLRVELQRGQARMRLENSRERLSFAQRDMAEALGYPIRTTFVLEPAPTLSIKIPSMQNAVATALSNRLDYAQVLQDYRDAQRAERIARRRMYPDLSLLTRYQRYGEGEGMSAATDFDEDYWFAGVTLGSDLNIKKDRIFVERSRITRQAAMESVRVNELSITREVQQQITAYRRARTEAGIAERNTKLAGGRAELARRLFRLGRGDNFSVTDAEESFAQAQVQLLTARADVTIAGYTLKSALGTLLDHPAQLKPVPLESHP
jgi:outer membrane protein TolC